MLRGQAQRQILPRDTVGTSESPLAFPLPLDWMRTPTAKTLEITAKCRANSISGFRDEEDLAHGFASFHPPMRFGSLGQRQPEANVEA
jgi:hypothetical protein